MTSQKIKDPQREFYDKGYAENRNAPASLAIFAATPNHSRTARGAEFLPMGQRLLDVGCGDGNLLYRARNSFAELHGVDIVRSRLDIVDAWSAHIGVSVQTHLLNIDTTPLPYVDSFFDAVTSIVLLEFVFDPKHVIGELVRVLRSGGTLVISVGNIASWKNRLRLGFGRLPHTTCFAGAVNGGSLHFFTPDSLRSLLQASGVKVVKHTCSGRLYKIKTIWPTLLGGDIFFICRKV